MYIDLHKENLLLLKTEFHLINYSRVRNYYYFIVSGVCLEKVEQQVYLV